MSFVEWLQSLMVVLGVVILFGFYMYKKYPRVFKKLSSVLKRVFNLRSKKGSKNAVKNTTYTDEEMIDIIQGSIKRYMKNDDYTAKQCIKRIKEIVD